MKHALRFYLSRPGFTLVVVATLALGMGAVTAVFSVANAVLLRTLPYRDAGTLAVVWEDGSRRGGSARTNVASANFVDWRAHNRVFEDMAIVRNTTLTLTSLPQPHSPLVHRVSANYFDVLGTQPLLGRTFRRGEDVGSPAPVVILGYGLWQSHFGGDPAIVGRSVLLDDVSHTVVGVMRRDFYSVNFFPTQPELWVPLSLEHMGLERHVRRFLTIGRLKPGMTLAHAREDLGRIAAHLQTAYPDTNRDWGTTVISIREQAVGDFRRPLVLLLLAAGFVLAIACFNVANLLLARGVERGREIAVRLALGGSAARVSRQLLSESVLLAVAGGGLGLLVAAVAVRPLVGLIPEGAGVPFLDTAALDGRVWAFTFVVCLITGVLFGLVPSRQAFTVDLVSTLRQGGRGATRGALDHRFREGLIVVEIALAVALLMGEGLLLRTFQNLRAYEPGFEAAGLSTMTTALRGPRYATPEQRAAFFRQTLEDVRRLPGVVSASAASDYPPIGNFGGRRFSIVGRPAAPGQEPHAMALAIEPRYFETMRIPLRLGRVNDERDTPAAPLVAVVSQSVAQRWFPDTDAVGQLLALEPETAPRRIVGVVGDVVSAGVDPTPRPVLYLPYAQAPDPEAALMLRTRGDPTAALGAARTIIVNRDRMLPVYNVRTMEQVLTDSGWVSRFTMTLLGVFAVLSVALVSAGTYAVLSFIVSQRTQEIGIRMALGARGEDILRMIVRRGVALALAGAVLGTIGFAWGSRALATLLFDVKPFEPVIYAAVLAAVFGITLLACYLPARNASRVSPLTALRRS